MAARWRTERVAKWIAHRQSDGLLVGRGGLSLRVVIGERRLELGWALRDRQRGRGYATEIGAAGLAYAFDTLNWAEVVAYTDEHNHASRAVMNRLGMEVMTLIQHHLVEGHGGTRDNAPLALYGRRLTAPGNVSRPTAAVLRRSMRIE